MQQMGIRELYRPFNGLIDVDIVAVHGLQGDAIGSWTSKSKKEICWLSHPDFLPKYLPQARILTWGYNANVLALKGRTASNETILRHAQTLVAQLYSDRDALAYSAGRTASNIAHLHSIYTCTYGILFFGTPHLGSSKANMLSTVRKLAAVTVPMLSIEGKLVSALEEGSETLQDINDQFCPLMSRFHVFFFWEQEKTNLLGLGKKDHIVEEASAAPVIDNTERCGIAADHSSMCKFSSPTDQGFRDAVAALKRYVGDASSRILQRRRRAQEILQQKRHDEVVEALGLYNDSSNAVQPTVLLVAQQAESLRRIQSLPGSQPDIPSQTGRNIQIPSSE